MTAYIIRRLIEAIIVIILISLLVFFAMRTLPGDPLMIYIMQQDISEITPEIQAQLRHEFGLDKSLPMQYIDWINGLLHGNMGKSIFYNESVTTLMLERIPITLTIGLISIVISGILGIIAGLVAALRRGSALDNIVTSLANFGISAPNFWLGVMMIYFFGLYLGWLPIQGYTSPLDDLGQSIRQLIMPVFVLANWGVAFIARQTRSSMLEVVRQDYIRTAWAKGLRESAVVMRHVIKNGLIPVITVMGIQLSRTIGGQVIIENVFNIPGVGRLMVSAVFGQDYQVVQAGVLLVGIAVVICNFLVDVSYGWIDPRVRYD
ncbi:MAG TPA: ABC transporter permease [Dehalococcoidales bacterium]|nr:ABC transporter permease [Dehalococcoidales bacterium]